MANEQEHEQETEATDAAAVEAMEDEAAEEEVEEVSSEESKVFFRHGNHEFRSEDELRGFLKAQEQVIGRQGQELGQARKTKQAAPAKAPAVDKAAYKKRIAEALTEDPEKAAELLLDTAEEIASRVSTQTALGVQGNIQFWDTFFTKNRHLASQRSRIQNYVDRVLFDDIADLSERDQAARIKDEWEQITGVTAEADEDELEDRRVVSAKGKKGAPSKVTSKKPSKAEEVESPASIARRLSYSKSDF